MQGINATDIIKEYFQSILKKNGFANCEVSAPYCDPSIDSSVVRITMTIEHEQLLDMSHPQFIDELSAPLLAISLKDLFEDIKKKRDELSCKNLTVLDLFNKILEIQEKNKPERKKQKSAKKVVLEQLNNVVNFK